MERYQPPTAGAAPAVLCPGAAPRAAPAPETGAPPAVHAQGLVKTYPGGHRAVDGVDLTVAPGEIFGFLGPNGAGKSTTIAMLCALARPSAGHAAVFDADVTADPQRVRRLVGLLLQHTALDPEFTCAQNLYTHARLHQLSRPHARARIREVLELTGLTDRRAYKARTLSGGMLRRLEIARALLHEPRLLFLDEPTTGLDPHARAQIWQHLTALRASQGTTLFVTTHYLDEAEHCDRIAIIDHGRIVVCDTPTTLKAALGRDRIHLRTSDDQASAAIVDGLLPANATATAATGELVLTVPDATALLPRLVTALVGSGIALHALTVAQPTLDDVFLHYTGRHITTDTGHHEDSG
ncbi:ATP-binding cassette domain-containing protein [Spirillospora sp. CA-253888]